jgi:hypothetical protein
MVRWICFLVNGTPVTVFCVSILTRFLRFAYSDYGLAHALGARTLDSLPITIAYDSACSYSVNIASRFQQHLPDLHDVISRTRFAIDSLHVHDHIDKCMYNFSTEYMENTGHFHGVGVEQFWAVQNQSGPKTSQMNPGHRTDSITEDIEDWNWKKMVKIGKQYVLILRLMSHTNIRR